MRKPQQGKCSPRGCGFQIPPGCPAGACRSPNPHDTHPDDAAAASPPARTPAGPLSCVARAAMPGRGRQAAPARAGQGFAEPQPQQRPCGGGCGAAGMKSSAQPSPAQQPWHGHPQPLPLWLAENHCREPNASRSPQPPHLALVSWLQPSQQGHGESATAAGLPRSLLERGA